MKLHETYKTFINDLTAVLDNGLKLGLPVEFVGEGVRNLVDHRYPDGSLRPTVGTITVGPEDKGRAFKRLSKEGACQVRSRVLAREFDDYTAVAAAYTVMPKAIVDCLAFDSYRVCVCRDQAHLELRETVQGLIDASGWGQRLRAQTEAIQTAYDLPPKWRATPPPPRQ